MRGAMTEHKGVLYAIVCVSLYATFNIYFKAVAVYDFHPILFIASGMMFASVALMLFGGPSRLALDSMKSPYTWGYGVSFVLQCTFCIYLMRYVSATEMVLLSHISILLSLVMALVFLKRNTLGKGIWGVPFILGGISIIFYGVEDGITPVILFALGLAASKSLYYFSIELNKVGYETQSYLEDFSVVGYILAVTSLGMFIPLFIGSVICETLGVSLAVFPAVADYASPSMYLLAAGYGVFGVTALRTLEFKSIQRIKSEIFLCILTITPLATLLLELSAEKLGMFDKKVSLDLALLAANIMIIIGGLIVVLAKYLSATVGDEAEIKQLRETIRSTQTFCKNDMSVVAQKLDISRGLLETIIDNKAAEITKLDATRIRENFARNIAMADPLTGLMNRLQFTACLKRIYENRSILFFLDLNKFKPINDTHGHEAGDLILQAIARRLVDEMPADADVTRLGGDEFCVLMPMRGEQGDIDSTISALLQIIEKPVHFAEGKVDLSVSASIGYAVYPDHTDIPEHLITIADERMYENKGSSSR